MPSFVKSSARLSYCKQANKRRGIDKAGNQRAFVRLSSAVAAASHPCLKACDKCALRQISQSGECVTVAQISHPCAQAQDIWHLPAGMVGFPAKHTTKVNQTSQPLYQSIWTAVCVCWEKKDPTCLVTTCTLAVAGRASKERLLQAREGSEKKER